MERRTPTDGKRIPGKRSSRAATYKRGGIVTEKITVERIKSEPEFLEKINGHVANGGCLIELCKLWAVRYSDVVLWIYADAGRKRSYEDAIEARGEWFRQTILRELRDIGTFDIRSIFNADGGLLDPSEWPEAAARAVAGLDIFEEYSGSGDRREQTGWTKKVKFIDRLRALEKLGQTLSMFVERHEHSGRVSIEDIVAGSHAPKATGSATPAADATATE